MRCGRGSDCGRGAVLMAVVPVAGKFWCAPACPSSGCRLGPSSDHNQTQPVGAVLIPRLPSQPKFWFTRPTFGREAALGRHLC